MVEDEYQLQDVLWKKIELLLQPQRLGTSGYTKYCTCRF